MIVKRMICEMKRKTSSDGYGIDRRFTYNLLQLFEDLAFFKSLYALFA